MLTTQPQPDLTAVKQRQQATWVAGNYAVIGTTLSITDELLCEAVALRPGQRVLDVAAGNGNTGIRVRVRRSRRNVSALARLELGQGTNMQRLCVVVAELL